MSGPALGNARQEHFRTDGLKPDLKRRAVRSGAAMMVSQGLSAVLAIGSTMILARLLQPEDFGIVAMALPIAVLGAVLRNFGLDVALVQRDDLDQDTVSHLFRLALKLNLLLGAVLAACAPLLMWIYGEPRVLGATLVLAGGVATLGLAGIHEALLKRQMRFGLLSWISLTAAASGAASSIALAFAGAGYWALVAQIVMTHLIHAVAVGISCHWRPSRATGAAPPAGIHAMWHYGRNLTGTRVLTVAASYADRIAIGVISGPALLGLYENGRRLPFFLLDRLYDACFSVAVAGFSRAGDDPERYRAFARRTLQLVLGVLLPGLAFCVIEARSITLLLLGDRWVAAVPFARLLAAAAFGQALTRALQWFYLSRGDTLRQLRWIALQAAVTFAAVGLGGWVAGGHGVAWAFTLVAVALPFPAVLYGLRHAPFTARDFAVAALAPVLLSLGVGAAVWATAEYAGPASAGGRLVASFALFAVGYASVWMALPVTRRGALGLIRNLARPPTGPQFTPPRSHADLPK